MRVNILLFIGIESFTWSDADFARAVDFCKQHHLDGLLVKVFDGMLGEWYNDRFPEIFKAITSAGLICVPYGFHYGYDKGSDLAGEAQLALKYLKTCGSYCANMESSWDGMGDWAGQLATLWADHPGELWISTWGNVGDESGGHRWLTAISHLTPIVQAWMPQCYSQSLYAAAQNDWPKGVHLEPTFALSDEFGANNPLQLVQGFLTANHFSNGNARNISLWEYQLAQTSPTIVDDIVQFLRRGTSMPIMLNQHGMVANFVEVSQFEPNETEMACGFFAGGSLRAATPPDRVPTMKPEDVDNWSDQQYAAVYGSYGANQGGGISVDQLHAVFHNAGLHYWDITAIAPGSAQSSDLAHIKGALQAGYPVVATVVEASVRDLTGDIPSGNPYEWNPVCDAQSCMTHVLVWVGIAPDGHLLAIDYANVVGPLQGSNTVRPWPRKYDIATINNNYACVVQLVGPDPNNPWLKPIPSGDPTTWPANFNGQNFAQQSPPPDDFPQETQDCWNSFLVGVLGKSPAPFTTGIANAWLAGWVAGKHYGPPLTYEYHSKNAQGRDIVVQEFAHARCEWDGTATFYSISGKV